MRAIVLGNGPMGRAMASALEERGHHVLHVFGRPAGAHPPEAFAGCDVVFDFSRGEAVGSNAAAAVAGGASRFVIGATGWSVDPAELEGILIQHRASAVAAPSFSPGVNLLTRLVASAARMFAALPDYDPYVVEWHRRGKVDQPSGTALALARTILAVHPGKRRLTEPSRGGPRRADELEVASVRAGSSPGMHVVGFDAAGETIELRLTARDRSAYAFGALAAATWLLHEPRAPGLHAFDEVVDAMLAPPSDVPPASAS